MAANWSMVGNWYLRGNRGHMTLSSVCLRMQMCTCVRACALVPLRQLAGSALLSRGVHVADHEVFGDFLHVLVVEEGIEAEFV